MLTQAQVAAALPANLKGAATQSFVDKINNITTDPIFAETVRENFIHYTAVLKDGRFKTEDYLNAVLYVSFKLMNMSNNEAYMRTFPQRHADLVADGRSSSEISAYVSAYNKGKLVTMILEQSMVPTYVLNAHLHQKAVNTCAEIMEDPDVSAKVRVEAANALLTHLKRPEAIKNTLDITVNDVSGMTEMKEALRKLSAQQLELIENGVTTRDIAAMPLIEGESTVISDGN